LAQVFICGVFVRALGAWPWHKVSAHAERFGVSQGRQNPLPGLVARSGGSVGKSSGVLFAGQFGALIRQ